MWCRLWSIGSALLVSGLFQHAMHEYSFWLTQVLIMVCFLLVQELFFAHYEKDNLRLKIETQRFETFLANHKFVQNVEAIDKEMALNANHRFLIEFRDVKEQLWNIEKTLAFQMETLKRNYRKSHCHEITMKPSSILRIRPSNSFNGFSNIWS
jgi:hypothetical protein